jgi:hypothetical protein
MPPPAGTTARLLGSSGRAESPEWRPSRPDTTGRYPARTAHAGTAGHPKVSVDAFAVSQHS